MRVAVAGKEVDPVNYATGKEFLYHVRTVGKLLTSLENYIQSLYDSLYSIGGTDYSKDRVDGGVQHDLADKIAKITAMRSDALSLWDTLIDDKQIAMSLIKLITNDTYQAVLIERYINTRTWDYIADRLHFSRRYLYKVHGKALIEFNRIYQNQERT